MNRDETPTVADAVDATRERYNKERSTSYKVGQTLTIPEGTRIIVEGKGMILPVEVEAVVKHIEYDDYSLEMAESQLVPDDNNNLDFPKITFKLKGYERGETVKLFQFRLPRG